MMCYVAGISLIDEHINLKYLCIKNHLPKIVDHAKAWGGDNVVVLVVLREYALTKTPILNQKKKEILKHLQELVSTYQNMILIPGSFLAYEDFSTLSANERGYKFSKINANYNKNHGHFFYANDKHFKECREKFKTNFNNSFSNEHLFYENRYRLNAITNKPPATKMICFKNSSYILTANSPRIKHKKSAPFLEEKVQKENHFYGVGADNPIKNVALHDGNKMDIGLIICRDHVYITDQSNEVRKNLPAFQVIVSATITLDQNKLFGAYNIQMDSDHLLVILINDAHPKYNKDLQIKGCIYYSTTCYEVEPHYFQKIVQQEKNETEQEESRERGCNLF